MSPSRTNWPFGHPCHDADDNDNDDDNGNDNDTDDDNDNDDPNDNNHAEKDQDDPVSWYDYQRRSLETIAEEPRTPLPLPVPQPLHHREDVDRFPSSLSSSEHLPKPDPFIENPVDFPDTGVRAWAVVGAAAAAHFCTAGVAVACAGAWVDVFSRQAIKLASLPTSIMICAMLSSSMLCNYRFDRHPPPWLLPVSSLVYALCLCLASIPTTTPSYPAVLVVTYCFAGASAGCVLASATAAVQSWFLHRRRLALALATLGAPLGGTLLPAIILGLRPLVGLDWTIRIVGLVVLAILAPVCLLARPRYRRCHGIEIHRRPIPWSLYREALRHPPTLLLLAAAVLVAWGVLVPLTCGVVEARQLRLPDTIAMLLLPVFSLGALAAQLASPCAASVLGRLNFTLGGTMLGALALLAVRIPSRRGAALVVSMAMVGFAAGTFASGVPELFNVLTPEPQRAQSSCGALRARLGLVLLAGAVASMTAVPAAGAAILHSNFLAPLIFGGASLVLASGLLMWIRCRAMGLAVLVA